MATMTVVKSPVPGEVHLVTASNDPVFAGEMLGAGVLIKLAPHLVGPEAGAAGQEEWQSVLTPVAGTLSSLHPHAFVVTTETGVGILVHMGIDTVKLAGEGFRLTVSLNDRVELGDEILSWQPGAVASKGYNTDVIVVALQNQEVSVTTGILNNQVEQEENLFTVNAAS